MRARAGRGGAAPREPHPATPPRTPPATCSAWRQAAACRAAPCRGGQGLFDSLRLACCSDEQGAKRGAAAHARAPCGQGLHKRMHTPRALPCERCAGCAPMGAPAPRSPVAPISLTRATLSLTCPCGLTLGAACWPLRARPLLGPRAPPGPFANVAPAAVELAPLCYVNGRRVLLPPGRGEATLLEFLREKGLTGTKLGCGEGGCGACTIMVSAWDAASGRPRHRAVNACLAPLYSVEGCAVVTVEGIGNRDAGLHPVQARLAAAHGSQVRA